MAVSSASGSRRQRVVTVDANASRPSSLEICDLLFLTPENQRVLMHRARAKARAALEQHQQLDDCAQPAAAANAIGAPSAEGTRA
jgi:hypothetical protein